MSSSGSRFRVRFFWQLGVAVAWTGFLFLAHDTTSRRLVEAIGAQPSWIPQVVVGGVSGCSFGILHAYWTAKWSSTADRRWRAYSVISELIIILVFFLAIAQSEGSIPETLGATYLPSTLSFVTASLWSMTLAPIGVKRRIRE